MNTNKQKIRRKIRTRSKVQGTKDRPRLSVFRSNNSLYVQLIDDQAGITLLGVSQKQLETSKESQPKTALAKTLGNFLAKKALEKKIKTVVFDKGSYSYHGRIKALADGAREGGLVF